MSKTRDDRQTQIINNWLDVNKKGTLEACTGFGKTRVALRILKSLDENGDGAKVIVPTLYLKNQWEERIVDFGINPDVVSVDVVNGVVQDYTSNGITYEVELLVADEIHRYAAPEFSKLFECIKYESVLGLSATIPLDYRSELVNEVAPIFDRVTLKEALNNDWVSPYIVYSLPVEMTPEEREEYKKINSKYNRFFAFFDHKLGLVFKVLKNASACRSYANRVKRSPGFIKGQAANTLRAMNARKTFLHSLDSKKKVIKQLLDKFDDKLVICFGQTIEFADDVASMKETARPYHSQIKGREIAGEYHGKDRTKQHFISEFGDPDSPVNVLSTAKALDEGADIPSIDVGIIAAYSSKSLQLIQRIGRVIRKQPDKRAVIVQLYCPDSQEERWLSESQKKLPFGSVRSILSLDEIDV